MGRPWVRILAWWTFWMLVYALGTTQAWVFSDEPPKPPLIDVLGSLGFWTPMMWMFWPIFIAQAGLAAALSRLQAPPETFGLLIPLGWIGACFWSWAMAAAIVASEPHLLPKARGRMTPIVLSVTSAALIGLRLLTPRTDETVVYLVSSGILFLLVIFAQGCAAFCLDRRFNVTGGSRRPPKTA